MKILRPLFYCLILVFSLSSCLLLLSRLQEDIITNDEIDYFVTNETGEEIIISSWVNEDYSHSGEITDQKYAVGDTCMFFRSFIPKGSELYFDIFSKGLAPEKIDKTLRVEIYNHDKSVLLRTFEYKDRADDPKNLYNRSRWKLEKKFNGTYYIWTTTLTVEDIHPNLN